MVEKKDASVQTPEFLLVVIMLVVLFFLVLLVLVIPIGISPNDNTTTTKDMLDYRKDILAIIITAFGAWVGAGAAYYFGRENMREATSNMLAMREISPEERLRRTPIREIPPGKIDWVVKSNSELGSVLKKLKDEPGRWFIPVVKDDDTLNTIILEEGTWRFVDNQIETNEDSAKKVYENIKKMKVSDVIKYLQETEGLDRFQGEKCYVEVPLDKSAGYVHDLMQNKGVYLAIVTDEGRRPTHYINVSDVKKVLLKSG